MRSRARTLFLMAVLTVLFVWVGGSLAGRQGIQRHPLARGNPAHSHLFIINPFLGGLQRLFSTHPPVEEQIRRLEAMAHEMGSRMTP